MKKVTIFEGNRKKKQTKIKPNNKRGRNLEMKEPEDGYRRRFFFVFFFIFKLSRPNIETLCGGIYCSHMVSIWNEFCLIKLEYLFHFEISSQVGLEINPRF